MQNALISGYARQLKSITPEIIAEIAADFRLNVVHVSRDEQTAQNGHSTEVERAARTLLDLYAFLRNGQEHKENLRMIVGAGVKQ